MPFDIFPFAFPPEHPFGCYPTPFYDACLASATVALHHPPPRWRPCWHARSRPQPMGNTNSSSGTGVPLTLHQALTMLV
jgi:hypothetical protein